MTIPRTPNVKTKPTNDPKLAGMKGMTSLFIEKIPAVSAMGEMYNCSVRKVVRNLFLSPCSVIMSLPS
jgi:hypothetical protein